MKKLLALLSFLVSGFISYVAADVTAPSGRFLQIRDTLQPGSTVYFSSGTVQTYLSANGIMSLPHSATPPPTDCDSENERGRVYIDTNAVSGRQFYACEGTLGWILQGDGGSGGGSGTTILVKDGGSSIVNTSTLNFTGATFVVTNSGGEGLVAIDFSSVPSRSDVILNQNSLQTGSTFYVSSGTVNGQLSVLQIKFPDGTIQVSSPTAGVGSTPAGSNTHVQFNNAGAFGGLPNFTFDRSSNTLTVVGTLLATDSKDAIVIVSTSAASSTPGSGLAWNYPNFTGSTQTVFRIIPSQSASDTSTSTLVGFYVRGDNLLEEVMRIGEPSGSTVPHVVFPATGTRIQLTAGSFGTAYIEANSTSGDLVISPTSSANRIRLGDGAVGTVLLLFDTASNDGNVTWDGTADAFQVSDDLQLQAQNEARFADSDSSNYVGFKAAGTIGTNRIWELPSADGTSGQAITTNGSGVLSFTTISGGGGSASALEVFSNFDGTRSSPTASIGIGDTLKLTVSGSTAIINVDPANVILSTSSLQSGSTFYVSSGTVEGSFAVNNNILISNTAEDVLFIRNTQTPGNYNTRIVFENGPTGTDRTAIGYNANLTATRERGLSIYNDSGGGGETARFGTVSRQSLQMNNAHPIDFFDSSSSNYVAFKGPNSASTSNTYTVPSSSGTADQGITTDGSNNLRFQTVIVSTNGLQSGTTFYTSSGTATNFNATNATINTSLITNMYANFGAAYRVPYLDATNKFVTDPNFIFADFAQILYGPTILATSQMGAFNGASVVAYDADSSNFVGLKSSAAVTANNTYVLPASSGPANTAVLTDGSNNLSFQPIILSTNGLQDGATFYVSSGTISGDFTVITSSNGRSNYSTEFTTFLDQFFDTKILYSKKYLPSNDGSYGGLYYYLYASTRTENNYKSSDPVMILNPDNGSGGSASISAGSSSIQVSSANNSMVIQNGIDQIGMDSSNRTYINTSTLTVYGSDLRTSINTPGAIRLRENSDSDGVVLKGRSSMTGDLILNLPSVGASTNTVLKINSVAGSEYNLEFGDIRRAMRFSEVFNAEQAKLPGTNPCVISNSTAATIPSLLCDASTDESATWSTILTEYTTTTMRANIYYTMVSTNSGAVVHNIQVMCASSTYTADLDTENFGSVNASTITVPSSIGRIGIATVTVSAMPTGCVSGGLLVLKYNRDANAAADTASGDIELRKIWLYEP